jgi:Flp pilus assembly protein TadD
MYLKKGNYHDSIHQLNRALKQEPTNTILLNGIGTAYFKLGNYQEAKKHWGKSLEIDPSNIITRQNLINLHK